MALLISNGWEIFIVRPNIVNNVSENEGRPDEWNIRNFYILDVHTEIRIFRPTESH